MAVPTKDSDLVTFGANFCPIVSAAAATYNQTAAACTALTTAYTNFVTAFNAARADGAKSKNLTTTKDATKRSLLQLIRPMYAQIAALTSISDTQKVNLGITVRRPPSPQPAPSTKPLVTVLSVNGRTARLRLRDAANEHRACRPAGVASATIMSFVGTTPPTSLNGWTFEGNVTKTVVDVTFPEATAPGAQVWFTCFWANRKDESGPASDPVNTYLQLGSVTMDA